MFEQAELQGTQMGPNGPPNAKGTAQIAPEIANYRKPGVFGHFGCFGHTPARGRAKLSSRHIGSEQTGI